MFLSRPAELPPELLAASTSRDLDPGSVLYRRGDRASSVYVVFYGRLKLVSCTTEGKPVPLYVVRSGECVSEAALFADVYCSDVIAEVHSRVRAFPKECLQSALRDRPLLAAEFMALQTRRFNRLRIILEIRVLRSARERVLQYLRMADSSGLQTTRMDRPLKFLAEDLGLTHESFYRTLTQLIDEGLVVRTKGTLRLQERAVSQPAEAEHSPVGVATL